ncbi:hypothetical protein D9M72_540510 [compost metagenome]
MQAFQVVVDHHLPVGLHLIGELVRGHQLVDVRAARADFVVQAGGLLGQRLRVHVQIDEDQAAELFHAHRRQARVVLAEARHVLGVAHMDQLAVQAERPGVVGAGDHVLGLAGAIRKQLMGAVRADVVERAQHAVAAAHDEHVLAGHLHRGVLVVLGHLALVHHAHPAAREDRLLLLLEDFLRGVVVGRQRVGQRWGGAVDGGGGLLHGVVSSLVSVLYRFTNS